MGSTQEHTVSAETPAERYVADRMSSEEVAEFEARMMAEPAIAADVDARLRIKAGLERLQERGELAPLLQGPERSPRLARYGLAAAAAAVLLFAGIAVWRGGSSSPGVTLLAQPTAQATDSFILALTRGGTAPQEIRLRAGAGPVRLRVVPDDDATGPFLVELEDSAQTIALSPEGFVDVHLVAETPGTVEGTLKLTPASGRQQTFALRLIVSP
jgi:hypothetical protein